MEHAIRELMQFDRGSAAPTLNKGIRTVCVVGECDFGSVIFGERWNDHLVEGV